MKILLLILFLLALAAMALARFVKREDDFDVLTPEDLDKAAEIKVRDALYENLRERFEDWLRSKDLTRGSLTVEHEPHKLDSDGSTPSPATSFASGTWNSTTKTIPAPPQNPVPDAALSPDDIKRSAFESLSPTKSGEFSAPDKGAEKLSAHEHNRFPKGRWA